MPFSWIPSYRDLSDATIQEDREAIPRNDEVDKWAKIAICLPLPPCDPLDPSPIVICSGIAPTPAKKWVLQCRRTFGFLCVHWVSGLPLKGTKRMLWLRWLWGNVRWEGPPTPPSLGKRQLACAPCVVRTMVAQPICALSNVMPRGLRSRNSGSVVGGNGLKMPLLGITRQHMKTSYISLAWGSLSLW